MTATRERSSRSRDLTRRAVRCVGIVGVVLALGAAGAGAAGTRTKVNSATVTIPAHQTRALSVPFPDALEYGNARYSGHVAVLAPLGAGAGGAPKLAKVKILSAQSAEGGSIYAVRAYNGNALGTRAVRLRVTATTVEPLPHS